MSDSQDKPRDNLPFEALDLAPSWAQGPRTPTHTTDEATRHAPDARSRSGRRPSATSRRPTGDGPRNSDPRRTGPRQDTQSTPHNRYRDQRLSGSPSDVSVLPITVHFIPARHGMETLARRFAESRRAFPLGKLTALFLDRLESLVVRLSPDTQSLNAEEQALPLFQCRLCRTVYLDKERLIQHVLTQHLDRFYRLIETEIEAPNGAFACVARCGMSGELIGPPNYHGYHERLTALHRERFSHISFDAYRTKLDMSRDPDVIEAWKESMRKQTFYYPVNAAEKPAATPEAVPDKNSDADVDMDADTNAEPDSDLPGNTDAEPANDREKGLAGFNEVKQHFLRHRYTDAVHECVSCVIPGAVARQIEDEKLRRWIETAWRRESRSIMRTAITVRGIFRSLGFTAFKTSDQRAFMTAVVPHPLQDKATVDTITRMLDFVDNNPGCTRVALWEHLGLEGDETAGSTEARHFHWLVDKGHLIFFHDGTLTLPRHLHAIRAPTASKKHPRKKSGPPKKKSNS